MAEGDDVRMDGRPISARETRTYIMLHKPRGYVTTLRDERGRPTVADLVENTGIRLFPVGRLDYDSEGLLIMTNDGEIANRLAHPSHGVEKTYRIWVSGEYPPASVHGLEKPIEYQGVAYRPAKVRPVELKDRNAILDITISEGKNREVRNMCAAVGLRVNRLVRIRQGELRLGDLPAGKWRALTREEIDFLRSLI